MWARCIVRTAAAPPVLIEGIILKTHFRSMIIDNGKVEWANILSKRDVQGEKRNSSLMTLVDV